MGGCKSGMEWEPGWEENLCCIVIMDIDDLLETVYNYHFTEIRKRTFLWLQMGLLVHG